MKRVQMKMAGYRGNGKETCLDSGGGVLRAQSKRLQIRQHQIEVNQQTKTLVEQCHLLKQQLLKLSEGKT